jgi:hypothetical protein
LLLIASPGVAGQPAHGDLCTRGIAAKATGEVVVAVTLLGNLPPGTLPVIGADDYRRLVVNARVDKIIAGKFRHHVGAAVGLAVHSVVHTFGSDYVGGSYEVGLNAKGDSDYVIVSIVPSVAGRLLIRGRVVAGRAMRGEKMVKLDSRGDWVRIKLTEIRGGSTGAAPGDIINLHLPLRSGATPKPNEEVCVVAMSRPAGADAPYRILRVVY